MSEWGDIVTALEALVRTAAPTMPAGAAGFTRGYVRGQDLATGHLPHCSAHSPTEVREEIDHGQLQVQFSIQLDTWFQGAAQEDLNAYLDALKDQIAANPTLGGAVEFAFPSQRAAVEHGPMLGGDKTVAVAIVRARWIE